MNNSGRDRTKSEQLLESLEKELQAMSDTEVLAGHNPEDLVKLGERLLESARKAAGQIRLADAKRLLSIVAETTDVKTLPSVEDARKYLLSLPDRTLAARSLSELSETDVLDLFVQAKSLERSPEDTNE